MPELQSELIQMNTHMVRVKGFDAMLGIGIAGVVIFLIMLAFAISDKSKFGMIGCGFLACAFAALIVVAVRLPQKKEIRACANGPVSIEQIAAVYDIVEVDGKMLTLRER